MTVSMTLDEILLRLSTEQQVSENTEQLLFPADALLAGERADPVVEAGDLAVEGLEIDTLRPRTWKECRDFAVFIGGPNPALRDDQPYSEAHFAEVCSRYGDSAVIEKYQTVFIDSITVAGRLCLQWSKGQPQAYSEKTGKPDSRGAYGLMGQEMIGWLTHLQHTRRKNVWFGHTGSKAEGMNPRSCTPTLKTMSPSKCSTL